MSLRLYNTLTRTKEELVPLDPANVRMYVCGPTVYDFAHIGNARPVIVFDLLFRLLRQLYGAAHVTYVRNITDVDDKINARSRESGEPIAAITARTTADFHRDMAALGALPPDLDVPVVVVQHMAEGFVEGLAGWLDGVVALPVSVALSGDRLHRRDAARCGRGTIDRVRRTPEALRGRRLRPGHGRSSAATQYERLGRRASVDLERTRTASARVASPQVT